MPVKIDGNGPITGLGPAGQCRLVLSAGNIVLQPYQGDLLCVGGANIELPPAGVTLAPAGLAVGALLYVYASYPGSVWTLTAEATVPTADAVNGSQIKTGDPLKALVGMVYLKTGPVFADTAAARLVASWFNPRPRSCANFYTAVSPAADKTNTSYAELDAAARVEFLTWGDAVNMGAGFSFINSGANTVAAGIAFDGIALGEQAAGFAHANNLTNSLSARASPELARGYHYATMVQRQTGGTTTWWGNSAGFQTERCAINGTVNI